jgi:hypothetical protein
MAARAIVGYLGSQGAQSLVNYSSQIREVFSAKYKADRRMDLLSQFSSFGSKVLEEALNLPIQTPPETAL